MAQDREPKIPVLKWSTRSCSPDELDGFRLRRHARRPRDLAARGRAGLDAAARQHGAAISPAPRARSSERSSTRFADGALHGEVWDELAARAWSVLMRAVLSAFYSHPWAWNEIGFGGPAYPRGYARLGAGQRESWEGAPRSSATGKDARERGVEGT